jgi:GST-like protein
LIDLYYWPTPNGWKISIALEELGIAYRMIPVDIGRGAQFEPGFLAISPNNRIPAIVDRDPEDGGDPISVFESGAILLYLAEKTGRLIPRDPRGRKQVIEWLMWQMGGLGPMLGQAHHFRAYAPERIEYAIDRYTKEANRLYGVLDKRLEGREYIAGDYSIADIACWPWIVPHERQGQKLEDTPHLHRWFERIRSRPAVQRGQELGRELREAGGMDEKAKQILFGQTARR